MNARSDRRPALAAARDAIRAGFVLGVGLGVLAAMAIWHRLASSLVDSDVDSARCGRAVDASDASEVAVVEHELDWYRYVKAFDAHHGPGGSANRDVATGSFVRGLGVWLRTRCLRGYTLGDDVYVLENAPRVLRVHQAGHAPAFGGPVDTLVRDRRDCGGLPDEPLRTFDVMLPGDFPHTFLRFRDARDLTNRYEEWLASGRIRRVPA